MNFFNNPHASSSSSNKKRKKAELPWVEKYRPKTIQDVAYQDEVVNTLTNSLDSKNLPHLLFYGPPGTGKTSTILAITKQLYGDQLFSSSVKELNASDDRGIHAIREKVKTFATTVTPAAPTAEYKEKHPCPPFKVIILDEADSMTVEAQSALRRIMEIYSKNTRFCIICNYISRIIDPIASRCAKFRFKPLTQEGMSDRLNYIAEQEGFSITDEIIETLSFVSNGDLRAAITLLQSSYRLEKENIQKQTIINISGRIHQEDIDILINACQSNSFDVVMKTVNRTTKLGYNANLYLEQLLETIIESDEFDNLQKAHISLKFSEINKKLIEGADEFLQYLDASSFIMKTLSS